MNNKNFTIAQKIGKESTISFVGMGYGQFVRYLFTVVLARLVGVSYLGLYSLGNSIVTLASVIAKAGLDVGLMRFISRRDLVEDKEKIKFDIYSSLKIGILLSLFVMILLIIFSGWLVGNVFHEGSLLRTILIINSLAIPFLVINLIMLRATQGFQLLKYKVFIEYILNPTLLLAVVIFAYYSFSVEMTVIIPLLITSIICSIVASIFIRKLIDVNILKVWKHSIDTEILKYSIPIMFSVILGTMLHWLDVIMLGYYTDSTTVGLYHPIIRTAGIQNSILVAFSGIFAPMFTKYFSNNDTNNMQHIYQLVTRWILSLLVPIFIFVLLFSKKIMLIFGAEFISVSNILILLTVGTSIYSLFGISGSSLVLAGYQKLNLLNTLAATVLNIILNIIFIPKFGLPGAAWATVIALIFVAVIRVVETIILISVYPFYLKDIKALIAGTVTFLSMFVIKPYIMGYHTIITILLAVIFIAAIYLLTLYLLKFDDDDKDFFKSVSFLKNKVINARK